MNPEELEKRLALGLSVSAQTDPEEPEAVPDAAALRERGAHVLELDPIEIEGATPYAHEGGARRAREAVADFFSALPERARAVPYVGDALGDWLDSGEAPTAGVAEGLTFGFADELAGAGSALTGGDYEEGRDRARARATRLREESPTAFGLGELAGGLATTPFLPGGATAGMGRAARAGMALGEGALYGGLAGAGHSEGDITTEEGRTALAGDVAEGVLGGGLTAGVLGGAGEVVGAAGSRLLSRAGRGADRARVAATIAGPGTPLSTAAERRLEGLPGGLAGVAERIRRPRTDAAGPFRIASVAGTGDDALAALERARESAGTTAGAFNETVDAALPSGIPAADYERALSEALGEFAPGATIGRESSRRAIGGMSRDIAASTGEGGTVGNAALRDYLNRVNERASRVASRGGASDAVERAGATRAGARALRRAYDDAAEAAVPGIREPYRAARHDYATVEALREIAEDAARRRARSGPGLTSTLAASGERARGGGIPTVLAVRELVGSARARLPAMEATAREVARGAAPTVGRARAPRGLASSTLERVLEEALGARDDELAAAPGGDDADVGADLGFVPDELGAGGDDDFGFVPDEDERSAGR